MSINNVVLLGRLGRDPETKYFDSGNAVCQFSMALDRGPDRDGNDQPPVWAPVKLWGKQAIIANDFLRKGSLVAITGKLEIEEWQTRDGEKRSKMIVVGYRFTACSPKPDGAPAAMPALPEELPF